MNEKQYLAMVANMRGQSLYQQQMIGYLVGLVHGLKGVLAAVAERSGMDQKELDRIFADAARTQSHALAEIPFPEFQWPDADSSSDATPPPLP